MKCLQSATRVRLPRWTGRIPPHSCTGNPSAASPLQVNPTLPTSLAGCAPARRRRQLHAPCAATVRERVEGGSVGALTDRHGLGDHSREPGIRRPAPPPVQPPPHPP